MRRGWVVGGFVAGVLASGAGLRAQNVSEQYLLAAANRERATHNLGPVRIDGRLLRTARLHAEEMARRGAISHQFAGEAELAERAGDAGARFSLVTENVAEAPNSVLIHELWMKSAGHRANLLDPEVDSVGIAVVQKDGQLYAVEDFARTVEALTLGAQEAIVARLLAGAGVATAEGTREARETCTMTAGYAGARRPGVVVRYTSADLDQLPPELAAGVASGRYRTAAVGACVGGRQAPFTTYSMAVMLYP